MGDVHQLPPFTERADIVANLRELVDEHDKPVFSVDHQRACLLLFRLLQPPLRQPGMRWLIVERPSVLEWIQREFAARIIQGLTLLRVVARRRESSGTVDTVTVDQIRLGTVDALRLAAADWVLVGDDLIDQVAELLPANLLSIRELSGTGAPLAEGNALLMRQAWWLQRAGSLPRPYRERKFQCEAVTTFAEAQAREVEWLRRNDLAQEIAWRLMRVHELRYGSNEKERKRLREDLARLRPAAVRIEEPLAEIEDIGLPSILEVLQEGIGVERAKRCSALTAGWKPTRQRDFAARFESLRYQHRMHGEIAAFSREVFYGKNSLCDANTIAHRDTMLGWDFGRFPARRVWVHVEGREHHGVNLDEVRAMEAVVREFMAWARRKGPPARAVSRVWEVACLCFYVKQERAISDMLRGLTRDNRTTRFMGRDAPVEIVCGTVDRFQGREADLVLLSMRNAHRVGFLDSPNRLNVAVTRARQQLVVLGKHDYFTQCGVSELEALASQTARIDPRESLHRKVGA